MCNRAIIFTFATVYIFTFAILQFAEFFLEYMYFDVTFLH